MHGHGRYGGYGFEAGRTRYDRPYPGPTNRYGGGRGGYGRDFGERGYDDAFRERSVTRWIDRAGEYDRPYRGYDRQYRSGGGNRAYDREFGGRGRRGNGEAYNGRRYDAGFGPGPSPYDATGWMPYTFSPFGWDPALGWAGWGAGTAYVPFASGPDPMRDRPPEPPRRSPTYGRGGDQALRRWAERAGYDIDYTIRPRR